MFLDNYHELLGIIKKLGAGSDLGKVNKALKDLNEKADEFLEIYDENHNKEVDISELIEKRTELAKDLAKDKKESRSWGIVESIKLLEDKVVDYKKRGSLIEEENSEEVKGTVEKKKTKEFESIEPESSQRWLAVNMESEQASVVSLTSSHVSLLGKEEIEMQNLKQEANIVQQSVYGTPDFK